MKKGINFEGEAISALFFEDDLVLISSGWFDPDLKDQETRDGVYA